MTVRHFGEYDSGHMLCGVSRPVSSWMPKWESVDYPITCPDCLKLKPGAVPAHDPEDPAQRCCWHEWCEQPRADGSVLCREHGTEYRLAATSWSCLQFYIVDRRHVHSKSVKPTSQPSTTSRELTTGFTFPVELAQILPATLAWYIQTTTKAGKK